MKDYVIEYTDIKSLYSLPDTVAAFREAMFRMRDANRPARDKFVELMKKKKEEGKVRRLAELDNEDLYAIRQSLDVMYSDLSEIFGIKDSAVSYIFSSREVTSNNDYKILMMLEKYGFRIIDAEKFVEHITL